MITPLPGNYLELELKTIPTLTSPATLTTSSILLDQSTQVGHISKVSKFFPFLRSRSLTKTTLYPDIIALEFETTSVLQEKYPQRGLKIL